MDQAFHIHYTVHVNMTETDSVLVLTEFNSKIVIQ